MDAAAIGFGIDHTEEFETAQALTGDRHFLDSPDESCSTAVLNRTNKNPSKLDLFELSLDLLHIDANRVRLKIGCCIHSCNLELYGAENFQEPYIQRKFR